jgi:hypothetical protein
MEVLVFTPPQNGLVAFNKDGSAYYGIYLGLSGTTMRVFDPYTEVVVSIDIKDTDNYSLRLIATDYHHLARLGRDWGDGILVEYLGKQSKVRCLRNRYPPFNSDILVDTTDGTEIVVTDPQLKFVGHVKHRI